MNRNATEGRSLQILPASYSSIHRTSLGLPITDDRQSAILNQHSTDRASDLHCSLLTVHCSLKQGQEQEMAYYASTRITSSIEVIPSAALRMPSAKRVCIPSATAVAVICSLVALLKKASLTAGDISSSS